MAKIYFLSKNETRGIKKKKYISITLRYKWAFRVSLFFNFVLSLILQGWL